MPQTSFPPDHDPLADAALTPEQRAAWQKFRADHARVQQKLIEFQARQSASEETPAFGMILSRPEFNREVARLLALEERYGGTSSLIYFDCDNLGTLTEQSGRNVTNAAIRVIGDRLLGQVRACDIVGRLDASEFGVLLTRCGTDDAWRKAELLAEHMRDAVRKIHGQVFVLEVSFGAYTFAGREDVTNGIQSAARAMLGKKAS
ncbi:MAG: diguanylate cyclase [Alphaproteobacteria bacterium]